MRTKKADTIRLLVCGSRKWKSKKAIRDALKGFDYKRTDFVIIGTAPGAEQMALSVCRQLKFNVLLMPPNISRNGASANYFRNNEAVSLLKPTHVLAFHEDIENSSTTALYVKLAKNKKIDVTLYEG